MTGPSPLPPLRGRLSEVSADVRTLIAQTLTLARLEFLAGASKLARCGIGIVAGLSMAVAGLAVLISALVLGLIALGFPAWAAAALIGVLLTTAGAIGTVYFIRTARQTEIGLKQTRKSLRQTMEWLKHQAGT